MGHSKNNLEHSVFFAGGKIIIDKKYSTMIKTLRRYLSELGFKKEHYTILMKKSYIELHLQSKNAVNYILSDENVYGLDFTPHSEEPILIVTWKDE